jgi:hypothetical protein
MGKKKQKKPTGYAWKKPGGEEKKEEPEKQNSNRGVNLNFVTSCVEFDKRMGDIPDEHGWWFIKTVFALVLDQMPWQTLHDEQLACILSYLYDIRDLDHFLKLAWENSLRPECLNEGDVYEKIRVYRDTTDPRPLIAYYSEHQAEKNYCLYDDETAVRNLPDQYVISLLYAMMDALRVTDERVLSLPYSEQLQYIAQSDATFPITCHIYVKRPCDCLLHQTLNPFLTLDRFMRMSPDIGIRRVVLTWVFHRIKNKKVKRRVFLSLPEDMQRHIFSKKKVLFKQLLGISQKNHHLVDSCLTFEEFEKRRVHIKEIINKDVRDRREKEMAFAMKDRMDYLLDRL